MFNTILAAVTLALIALVFGWCFFNGFRKKYVHKETGVVFILKDVESTYTDADYTTQVIIYTLQSTETGKIIHISEDALKNNFDLLV